MTNVYSIQDTMNEVKETQDIDKSMSLKITGLRVKKKKAQLTGKIFLLKESMGGTCDVHSKNKLV